MLSSDADDDDGGGCAVMRCRRHMAAAASAFNTTSMHMHNAEHAQALLTHLRKRTQEMCQHPNGVR